MESLDLNIDNYNLPDILALFNLPTLFNEDDLKRARLAVLKTHPDKCKLPKEYFLFFTKAYRIIHQIYTIRHPVTDEHYTERVERTPRQSTNTVVPSLRCVGKDTLSAPYIPIDGGGGGGAAAAAVAAAKSVVDYGRLMRSEGYRPDATDEYSQSTHERMKKRLDEMMGVSSSSGNNTVKSTTTREPAKVSEFNKWFNEKFDQYRLKDDETETGYDDWFRSTAVDDKDATGDDTAEDDGGSWADKVKRLNQRKQELRNKYALVERTELEYAGDYGAGAGAGGGYDLTRERPQEYSSGIFGNLRYEDLKKAHTETVIPVTEEDYYNTKRFNNVNELQTFRDQSRRDLHRQTSKAEQEHIYEQSRMRQEEEDTRRAFILAKQDEISRDIHKKLYSDMFRLEN
jgi:hypothetical protein